MNDRVQQRLADIDEAITAIASHLARGDLSDGLIFDAVRIRLLEIGEAVKALPATVTDAEADIPWTQIARMRDHLAHRYFDTNHAIVQANRRSRPARVGRRSRPTPQRARERPRLELPAQTSTSTQKWARLGSNQRHLACKQNCHKRCADLRKWRSPTSEIETVVISLVSTRTCSRVTEYTKLTSDA